MTNELKKKKKEEEHSPDDNKDGDDDDAQAIKEMESERMNNSTGSKLKENDWVGIAENAQRQKRHTVKSFSKEALQKLHESGCHISSFEDDVWNMSMEDRIVLVQLMIADNMEDLQKGIQEGLEDYINSCSMLKEFKTGRDAEILEQKQIIGATITGAAINQELLREIQPDIVIVEEAAEVLEPQLLASICSSTKYLLLIGDHQQLRPQVDAYYLRKEHHFDISMMERLIRNHLPYKTLR